MCYKRDTWWNFNLRFQKLQLRLASQAFSLPSLFLFKIKFLWRLHSGLESKAWWWSGLYARSQGIGGCWAKSQGTTSVSGASLFRRLMMTRTHFLLICCTRLSLLIIVKARDSQYSSFHIEDEGLEERGGLHRGQVRFENQSMKSYKEWIIEVLSLPDATDVLVEAGTRKALDISLSMSVTKSHADLELWSPIGAWRRKGSLIHWQSSLPHWRTSRWYFVCRCLQQCDGHHFVRREGGRLQLLHAACIRTINIHLLNQVLPGRWGARRRGDDRGPFVVILVVLVYPSKRTGGWHHLPCFLLAIHLACFNLDPYTLGRCILV